MPPEENSAPTDLDRRAGSARLLAAARRLVEIVEGTQNERWSVDGRRLKDTTEWCEFYVALQACKPCEHRNAFVIPHGTTGMEGTVHCPDCGHERDWNAH